ncbi:MAG: RNA methyltransferase [Bacteroidales bacterium]|nr:RNA methyltransferase [Bacteroidales bacterium]
MLSKNTIKFINSLKVKKYRQLHQAFIVEGEKSVNELIHGQLTTKSIYCTQSWYELNSNAIAGKNLELIIVSDEELSKISDLTTPNKVLALVQIPSTLQLESFNAAEMILALDGIRDPGNMGTILRTADWFGIRQIICSPDCVDLYNPKVVQATMGSFARVQIVYADLEQSIRRFPSIKVYGALLHGPSITEKKFTESGILIIGNESKGISPSLFPLITDPIFIPHLTSPLSSAYHAESLNASIANAIICYEIRKQLYENKF